MWKDVEKRDGPWESLNPPLRAFPRLSHTFRQREEVDRSGCDSRGRTDSASAASNERGERMNPLLGPRQAPSWLAKLARWGFNCLGCMDFPVGPIRAPRASKLAATTAESPANCAGLQLLTLSWESGTLRSPQNRVCGPGGVPVASPSRDRASCANFESRFFRVGRRGADRRTRQALRGVRAPGVSLRRCRNGGKIDMWRVCGSE